MKDECVETFKTVIPPCEGKLYTQTTAPILNKETDEIRLDYSETLGCLLAYYCQNYR